MRRTMCQSSKRLCCPLCRAPSSRLVPLSELLKQKTYAMDTNRYDDAARLCDEIIEVAGDAISERIAVAVQTTLALLSTEYSLG